MTTNVPAAERTPAPQVIPGPTTTSDDALHLSVSFSDARVAVISVAGELDMATTPRLSELLWPRLMTKLSSIIVDLTDVEFLGSDGLELLSRSHTYARHRSVVLCVVHSGRAVDRALSVSGLDQMLPCYATVPEAREAMSVL